MQDEDILDCYFRMIPEGLDVLITHGPPWGIMDRNIKGDLCGSKALYDHVFRVKPRVHVFGHIHEGGNNKVGHHGIAKAQGIHFYNVAWVALDENGPRPPNPPRVLDL